MLVFVLFYIHRWHSHAGLQAGDGLNGPLIVRQPKSKDENGKYYDLDLPDHVIMLQNWQNELGLNEFVPGFYQRDVKPPETGKKLLWRHFQRS